jgi:hypothetical protein
MDPNDGFLLKDSIKTGEVREVSKNIAIRGVYEMCFQNKGYNLYPVFICHRKAISYYYIILFLP